MTKKILLLHGYAQSATIFSAKTGGLRKLLQKAGYETIYVNAPLLLKGDALHTASDIELYGWWPYGWPDYEIIEAETAIRDEIAKHDVNDIEGIIGFSQGAGFSGFITARYKEFLPGLQWTVLFSGFKLLPDKFQHHYSSKLTTPTLHVIGELDTVVEESRSMGLFDACEESKRTLLKHQGGHFVPNSKSFVSMVLNWISSVTEARKEQQKESKEHELEDMFDAIDNLGKE